MLTFSSASVRIANTSRAIDECVEIAFGENLPSSCAVIVNAAIGHKLDKVAEAIRSHIPNATVLGTSCGGIIGREGVGEAMTNLAIMTVTGPESEYAALAVNDIRAANAYEKAFELATNLKSKLPKVSIVYLICPGLDISCDKVIQAFDDVLGSDVIIFGGTSADNYKAVATYQYINGSTVEHGAWALGFADETLKCAAKASHGFLAYGDPMTVTKAVDNQIVEIDEQPAWLAYSSQLSLIPDSDPTKAIIATGGLAMELPDDIAEEYGNPHILRGALVGVNQGVMYMSVTVKDGDRFWLTKRDEDLIFSDQERALNYLVEKLDGHSPVAVFQADCLARGRTLFNMVMKDELTGMMQTALTSGGEIPPWLGMYGFGEFCPLGGENTYHTYTTSLLVLYRD